MLYIDQIKNAIFIRVLRGSFINKTINWDSYLISRKPVCCVFRQGQTQTREKLVEQGGGDLYRMKNRIHNIYMHDQCSERRGWNENKRLQKAFLFIRALFKSVGRRKYLFAEAR